MDHKLQVYGLMELSLSDYGKPDLYYQELDFLLGDLYEELWEMAAEAKYAAGKKTNQLFPRWGPEIGIYPPPSKSRRRQLTHKKWSLGTGSIFYVTMNWK